MDFYYLDARLSRVPMAFYQHDIKTIHDRAAINNTIIHIIEITESSVIFHLRAQTRRIINTLPERNVKLIRC
jgi:hypothetical protein